MQGISSVWFIRMVHHWFITGKIFLYRLFRCAVRWRQSLAWTANHGVFQKAVTLSRTDGLCWSVCNILLLRALFNTVKFPRCNLDTNPSSVCAYGQQVRENEPGFGYGSAPQGNHVMASLAWDCSVAGSYPSSLVTSKDQCRINILPG